ncbi:HYR domain-containing protein [Luteirhabdus pelagi]|uniref:HYR domain-containing protein n=1 Tax=Luteirhabdus pelagi TaxID=2792783 RepID=UPI00193A98C4|nr:HYR domain-containing protein [Luteirhabdus pelagi]
MKSITYVLLFIAIFFGVNESNAQYCTTSGSAGNGAFIGEVCFPITSNPFNNCNQTNSGGNYGDFTGLGSRATYSPTPTAPNTNQVIVRVDRSNAGDYAYAAYIDFNQDQDFNDPGETVFTGSGSIPFGGGTSLNRTITVPASASNGPTRMRIIAKNGTTPVVGPCETGFNGEVEDYIVTITGGGVVCPTLSFTATPTNEGCPGANDGTIAITAPSGGTSPYSYSINGGTTYQASSTFTNLAPSTYQVRIRDANDCESSNQSISINAGVDNTAPVANCVAPFTIQLDGSGLASITAADINNGSTDNCSIASTSIDVSSFTCADIGPNTVTLTVTDAGGNSDTCTTTVTVADNVAPVANCVAPFTVQLDASGAASITATDINNGSTDNCSITGTSIDVSSFTCADIGPNTVTLTVTDASGNTDTCTTTVTVEDNIAPVANCAAPFTVQLDTNGEASITASDINNGSMDNCSISSTSIDVSSFTCADVGSNTVTLTVTDAGGNTDTCTTTVTVEDSIAPTLTCPSDITQDNDPDACGAVVTYTAPAVSDNCSTGSTGTMTFSYTGAPQQFVVPAGVTEIQAVVYGAQGGANWVNNVNYGGGVEATIPVVPGQTLYIYVGEQPTGLTGGWNGGGNGESAGAGGGGASDIRVGGTALTDRIVVAGAGGGAGYWSSQHVWGGLGGGLIGGAGYRSTPANPGGDPGTQTSSGNGTCASFNNPSVAGGLGFGGSPNGCGCEGYGGGAGYYGGAGSGNCRGGGGGSSYTAPTVTDVVHSQGVRQGNGEITITYNSTIEVTQTAGLASGSTFPIGTTTNTFVVTDASGNSATCSFDVTINDTQLPTITCPGDVVQDSDPGICGAVITYTTPVGADNCASPTTVQTAGLASGSTFPVGTTTNTFVVTDASGNTATCSFDVTINDNEAPVANCVPPFTVQLDASGTASITAADIDNGSTDNCGIASTSIDVTNFTCSDVGANTVILTVTDVNGNTDTCTTTVTVADSVAPVANCVAPFTVQLDASGTASITVADIDNGSTDNCGIASTSIDVTDFTCADVGPNTVTLTVTDVNGNTDTCTTTVTVADSVAPVANCVAPFTVQLDASGSASITAADIDNGSTDNCGIASTSIDVTDFSCADVGANTVTLTVTDVNGNTDTCTTTVTVADSVAPVANCVAPFTVQLDASGSASITVADIDNGSTDNCGIVSTSIDVTDFTCADVGPNTVTLTVTDVNGNTDTCTTTVTVADNVAPVANCAAPFTVQLDASGAASITATEIDNGSTDNCGIASTSIDVTNFSCADVGANTVTLTVTDVNGNTSTCSTTVTVEDTIAPSIACPADITANTDAGDCFATVTFPTPIALDNCGIDTVEQTAGLPSGSQFPVGVNTIEFMATDANGNSSTCSFTITVNDNEAPVAVCQDITIQLDANGIAGITAADVDGGSIDQCGVASTAIDIDTFDCSNVGANNVVLTVTDVNGNSSTCTAVVTVEDVTAPVVACQDITVELDPITGLATVLGTDIDNGSTDACGIASYDLDIDIFDCSNIGDNTVVLTVTDTNGNVETCTATVTVQDNTSPELVCQDFTIEIGVDGFATLDPSNVIASNDDVCGIQTVAVDITEFSCADIGTPVTVQVFSQDSNGNTSTCTATVTAVDVLAPVVTCPANQTVDPGEGNLFYILPDYFATGEATAFDNCTDSITITSQEPAAGTPLPDGVHVITLTATDEYGNVGTCAFELTVESELGVEDPRQDFASLSIYPVPTDNILNISNPQGIDLKKVEIYDQRGRLVYTETLSGVGTINTINVSRLAAATYYVRIYGQSGQITKRLIKE